jgi:hypothetical protein
VVASAYRRRLVGQTLEGFAADLGALSSCVAPGLGSDLCRINAVYRRLHGLSFLCDDRRGPALVYAFAPIYRPRLNQLRWALIAFGAIASGSSLMSNTYLKLDHLQGGGSTLRFEARRFIGSGDRRRPDVRDSARVPFRP